MDVASKRCSRCGEIKAFTLFSRSRQNKSGYRSWCKVCCQAEHKEQYERNKTRNAHLLLHRPTGFEKRRPKCQRSLPAEQFSISRQNIDGLFGWCKECRSEWYRHTYTPLTRIHRSENHLKRKYGISLAERNGMEAAQDGRCAVCDKNPAEGQVLGVDHNHTTGDIRGLLCDSCNRNVGFVEGSTFAAALDYLRQYNSLPNEFCGLLRNGSWAI